MNHFLREGSISPKQGSASPKYPAYETIGGLFRKLKQDYIECKLNVRILAVINQIMTFLEKITSDIDFQRIARELINNSSVFLFLGEKEPSVIQSYRNVN